MANDVRRRQILDAAARVLEREGPAALTMRRLGAELGIRAPSLYKHLAGKEEVEAALAAAGWEALAGETAGALQPLAVYRSFARRNRRLYALMAARPPARPPVGDLVLFAFAHGLALLDLAGAPAAEADWAWREGAAAYAPPAPKAPAVRSFAGPD
ncbi:MAG: helix-turn-helix transcriptional regulator [Thermoleophilia bacterium]|nr:helix-turn-helix transcriptional regulator [Thermoleophilia bacterium]